MPNKISRRKLLQWSAIVGGSAAIATPVMLMRGSSKPISRARKEAIFGHGSGSIPMNAANLTPMMQPIATVISAYAERLNRDVSFINRRDIVNETIERSRSKVAEMLGIPSPDDLAFVRNTSEANSIINNGLQLNQNDEVVVWHENHATNHRSWAYRQQRQGFSIQEVMLPMQPESVQQVVDAFVAKLSQNTRVVTFTELSNISGTRLPSRQLCDAIHAYNPDILVHVDGAQSWGCLNVNIEKMGCDSFSSSAHKWLMGPRGAGILYVNKKWASRILPSTLGYDFKLSYPEDELPSTARRFECLGQRDVAPYAAIGDTVDLFQKLGDSLAIEASIHELTQYALSAIEAIGLKTITPQSTDQGHNFGHAVVVIEMKNAFSVYGAFLALHNAGIAAAFISGAQVCCEPLANGIPQNHPTYLRLSPHIYNSTADIDRAVDIINRVNTSNFEIVKEVIRFI